MEEEYYKFGRGKFGLQCSTDEKKKNLKKFKTSIRRLMPDEPDEYWRQIYYFRHKQRVNEIDNALVRIPQTEISTAFAVNWENNHFNRGQILQSKIDRDNALLVADIHKIFSKNHKLEDNKNMKYMVNQNWRKRLAESFHMAIGNCELHKRLKKVKPLVPSSKDYSKWYREVNRYRLMASRFPPYWNTRVCAPFEEVSWERAKLIPRPIVYLDLEVLEKGIGRVVFELRADLVSMTAENFRSLCTGDRGKSYKCTEITVILNNLLWQGGSGVTSIYGESFPIENFKMKHDSEGILSMVNYGDKTSDSEFRISATALPPMDKKQVAFGKVIMGMSYLKRMSNLSGVNERGKPKTKIIVTGCGETTVENLMNLHPPLTLKEQRIAIEAKILQEKMKEEADEFYIKDEFEEIAITQSYTDINAERDETDETEETATVGEEEDEAKPKSSSSSSGDQPKKKR